MSLSIFITLHLIFATVFCLNLTRPLLPDLIKSLLVSCGAWLLFNQVCYVIPAAFGFDYNYTSNFYAGFFLAATSFLFKSANTKPQILDTHRPSSLVPISLAASITLALNYSSIESFIFNVEFYSPSGDVVWYHIPAIINLTKAGFWSDEFAFFMTYVFGHEASSIPFILFTGSVIPLFVSEIIYALIFIFSFELIRRSFFGRLRLSLGNAIAYLGFFLVSYAYTSLLSGKNDYALSTILFGSTSLLITSNAGEKAFDLRKYWPAIIFFALAGSIKPTGLAIAGVSLFLITLVNWRALLTKNFGQFFVFLPMALPLTWAIRSFYLGSGDINTISANGLNQTIISNLFNDPTLDYLSLLFGDNIYIFSILLLGPLAWAFSLILKRHWIIELHILGATAVCALLIALITPFTTIFFSEESKLLQWRLFSGQLALSLGLFLALAKELPHLSKKPEGVAKASPPINWLGIKFSVMILIFQLGYYIINYNFTDKIFRNADQQHIWGNQTNLLGLLSNTSSKRILLTWPFLNRSSQNSFSIKNAFVYDANAQIEYNEVQAETLIRQYYNLKLYKTLGDIVRMMGEGFERRIYRATTMMAAPNSKFEIKTEQATVYITPAMRVIRPHYIVVVDPDVEGVRTAWTVTLMEQPWARLIYSESKLHIFEVLSSAPWRID